MLFSKQSLTFVACTFAIATVCSQADARPRHRSVHVAARTISAHGHHGIAHRRGRAAMHRRVVSIGSRPMRVRRGTVARASETEILGGSSFASAGLVGEARRYIGTNPTGRRALWCGAFMDMILKRTGHAGGGNLASAYARYGTRVSGPQIGAIAVIGRRGGGHVGVVSGIDANGDIRVVSGNHNRTVAESVYRRGRIYAYVMPKN